MRPEIIINEPRVFDPQKYFYSRTDKRGVILGGNRIFFDVADYSPEQLIGAPHKIVRHPDMPRGAFHLIWSTIQAGDIAVGYVKNLARDGRFYWVLAVIIPHGETYISIRTAPKGQLYDATRDIYARMLKAEAVGMAPVDSAALMLSELGTLGIAGYKAYCAKALSQVLARDDAEACPVAQLTNLYEFVRQVAEARGALMDTLKTLYLIPTNMRILASRLEPSGGPISAISDSYKRAAAELMTRLNGGTRTTGHRSGSTADSADLIESAIMLSCAAHMTQKAIAQFVTESAVDGGRAEEEQTTLREIASRFEALAAKTQSEDTLSEIVRSVRQVMREAEMLKRLMAGLDQIRILGEVESGRLRNSDTGLAAIMSQLSSFHGLIHTRLTTMSNAAARMVAMEI